MAYTMLKESTGKEGPVEEIDPMAVFEEIFESYSLREAMSKELLSKLEAKIWCEPTLSSTLVGVPN